MYRSCTIKRFFRNMVSKIFWLRCNSIKLYYSPISIVSILSKVMKNVINRSILYSLAKYFSSSAIFVVSCASIPISQVAPQWYSSSSYPSLSMYFSLYNKLYKVWYLSSRVMRPRYCSFGILIVFNISIFLFIFFLISLFVCAYL